MSGTKIFISWSGDESRKAAATLTEYLRRLIPSADIFFSADDLHAGSHWEQTIKDKFNESQVAIVVLTPTNLKSPWLLFETGVLVAKLGERKIIPLLVGLKPHELTGPLSQFQSVELEGNFLQKIVDIAEHSEAGERSTEKEELSATLRKEIASIRQAAASRREGHKDVDEFSNAFDRSWRKGGDS